jgi:hypothetical protein
VAEVLLYSILKNLFCILVIYLYYTVSIELITLTNVPTNILHCRRGLTAALSHMQRGNNATLDKFRCVKGHSVVIHCVCQAILNSVVGRSTLCNHHQLPPTSMHLRALNQFRFFYSKLSDI